MGGVIGANDWYEVLHDDDSSAGCYHYTELRFPDLGDDWDDDDNDDPDPPPEPDTSNPKMYLEPRPDIVTIISIRPDPRVLEHLRAIFMP